MKLPSDDVHLEIEQEEQDFKSLIIGGKQPLPDVTVDSTRRLVVQILVTIVCFVAVLAAILSIPTSPDFTLTTEDVVIDYQCPSTVNKSLNDVGSTLNLYLIDDSKHFNASLKELKKSSMDGWGIPYVSVKRFLRPWKEQAFVKNIKSGDCIYESACGSGLNLLITTEILSEHDIRNITVYGNDYVEPSVRIANRVWNSTKKAKLGNICVGDSSNLSFVPSNFFDFTYTGYIDPIVDPLGLSLTNTKANKKLQVSIANCFSNNTKKQELAKLEQRAQQDWYASWTSELVRIAKPGTPVVVESSSESLCKHFTDYKIHDWGGVDKTWWSGAITEYGWNVDPKSLVIEDERITKDWKYPRYHVMMRKKK